VKVVFSPALMDDSSSAFFVDVVKVVFSLVLMDDSSSAFFVEGGWLLLLLRRLLKLTAETESLNREVGSDRIDDTRCKKSA
jgi:hypothetical protein